MYILSLDEHRFMMYKERSWQSENFFLIQLNLSATTTLGTGKSGHCREVETRVNV